MAGKPYISNVSAGARIANNLDEELIIFEGSGAALPLVKTDGMAVVIGAGQPEEYILGYFGPYRVFLSDLAIVTMCEEPMADEAKISRLNTGMKEINPEIKVVETIFRPRPLEEISGRKVFFATTAPARVKGVLKDYLEDNFDCKVVGISHNLSNRPRLRSDIQEKEGQFEVLLTELKAAAVDVATRIGLDSGVHVVYADNIPVTVGGDGDLKDLLLELAEKAISRFKDAKKSN